MNDFAQRLLENTRQFAESESHRLAPGLDRSQVYERLNTRAENNRRLMRETNEIIDRHISPVLADPMALSDRQADVYADLAKQLYALDRHVDIGLSFPLHKALLQRARARQDVDRTIFHLYWVGMISMRWGDRMLLDDSIAAFTEAAAFGDRYFEIESRETRLLLNKCIGNVYVALAGKRHTNPDFSAFYAAVDDAIAFWSRRDVRELDPDFPWDSFIVNSHQNMASFADRLRTTHADDKALARRVYDSVQALYGQSEEYLDPYKRFWSNSRTAYMVWASRYHVGMMSAEEITANLKKLVDDVKPGDYSQDGMYRMLHLSRLAIDYMKKIPGITDERVKKEHRRLLELVYRYCDSLPSGHDRYAVNQYLSALAPGSLIGDDAREYTDTVLRLTTLSHLPTYVHSMMVGRMMEHIARHFVYNSPDLLVGICGAATPDEVVAMGDDICTEARYAGLAHDVGKIAYVNTVALCSRRITDPEFELIKEHTRLGYHMFSPCVSRPWVNDVIRGHHLWHDGSRGYPPDFDNTRSEYQIFIDICSVADSIDAATDSVGRSYAPGRTLEFVIDEICQQAGTRYSLHVAEALGDPALLEAIRREIIQGRIDAYYEAYEYMESTRGGA